MDQFQPQSFTGLLIPDVPIRPQDYVHGAENNPLGGLGLRVVNPDGKWTDYRPPMQKQKSNKTGFESNDCTGFGYCRELATYLNYCLKNNLLPPTFTDWATAKGYIKNGSFMFDPQVLGIMAGTTSAGNWLQTVADTARKRGLAPAGTLPGPDGYATSDYAGFYNPSLITPEIDALCKEFLQYVDLPYQWLTGKGTLEMDGLKACPMYVALCTCGGWNNPPVPWCNAGNAANHAVEQTEDQTIVDSYDPDVKQLSADYNIPFQMMILASVKEQSMQQKAIGFKKANSATVYVQVGSCLVPVADWQAFVRLGGDSNSVVTLSDADFAKFTVADGSLFKSA